MKPGDLVQLNSEFLRTGEPQVGIYWSDEVLLEDWEENCYEVISETR